MLVSNIKKNMYLVLIHLTQVYWHQASPIFLLVHNSENSGLLQCLHYSLMSCHLHTSTWLKMLLIKGKSFIYVRNNRSPKTDP